MHIICTRKNLNQAVSIVERIVGRNTTLPILNNILLRTEKGGVKLSSTNLELGINCWVRAQTKEKGSITVPVKTLSNFINNLPEGNLTLNSTKELLEISCREFKAEIKGIKGKDFPLIPKIKQEPILNLEARNLGQICAQVVPAVAVSESRPEITGVLLDILPTEIIFVATDTYRLVRKVVKKENPVKEKISVIIPSQTIGELIRIFSELTGEVKVSFDKNQILLNIKPPDQPIIEVGILSRLIDGKYPDYKEIIPESFETKLEFLRDEFINKIKVISPFSSKVNDMKLEIKNGGLVKISTASPEVGLSSTNLKPKTSRDLNLGEIIFNYKYLLDGLENIPTEKVSLCLNSPQSPAALKPVGEEDYLYLIMPIKV